MFIITNVIKNIRRNTRKSAIYFAVCVAATLTLQVYITSIDRTQRQLEDLPAAMPISARVTSLDGWRHEYLDIKQVTVDGLFESPFVEDIEMTALAHALFLMKSADTTGLSDTDYSFNLLLRGARVAAANKIELLKELAPEGITWLTGYGPEIFSGNELVCVVDEYVLELTGYSLGDSVRYTRMLEDMFDYYGEPKYVEIGALDSLKVVGIMEETYDYSVALPLETLRQICRDFEHPFTASTASFSVVDTLRLNEFKAEMKAIELVDTSSGEGAHNREVRANALGVNDATFIGAATRLQESLSLLRGFLPLVAIAIAAVGYLVAYLAVQTRREEYAVYRLLGIGKSKGFFLFFAELAALTVCGSLLGAAVSVASGIGGIRVGALVFALFAVCFTVGGVIALLRLGRTNMMTALAQQE